MSEKSTLMDGIKWLEGLCRRLIPITALCILGVILYHIGDSMEDGNLISINVKVDDRVKIKVLENPYNVLDQMLQGKW